MSAALQPSIAPAIDSLKQTPGSAQTRLKNQKPARFNSAYMSLILPARESIAGNFIVDKKNSSIKTFFKKIAANVDELFNTAWDQLIGKKGYAASGVVSGIGYASLVPAVNGYNFIARTISDPNKFDFSRIISSDGLTNTASYLAYSSLLFCGAIMLNLLRKEGNCTKSLTARHSRNTTAIQKLSYSCTCFGFTIGAIVLSPFILSQVKLSDNEIHANHKAH